MAAREAAIELHSCIQYCNVWGWDPGNCISGQWKILQQANAASFADLKPGFLQKEFAAFLLIGAADVQGCLALNVGKGNRCLGV